MSVRKDIAKVVRVVMTTEDVTSTEVAEALGMSRSHLSQVLQGSGSTSKLSKILDYLGYELNIVAIKK